jgi:hypothetical protein
MMLAFILSPIGRYVAGALIALTALWGAYHYIKGTGYAQCKVEWNAANANAIIKGADDRAGGERDAADGVRDGFDRDK